MKNELKECPHCKAGKRYLDTAKQGTYTCSKCGKQGYLENIDKLINKKG